MTMASRSNVAVQPMPRPRSAILFQLALALMLTSAIHCLAAETNAAPATHDSKPPEFSAAQVLKAVNLTNIVQSEFVAWTARHDRVVLLGKDGTNHVAVLAYRDPELPGLWKLPAMELRMADGGRWIRGEWYYDHRPTRSEIEGFIRLLWHSEPASFTFKPDFAASSAFRR
jgi:hypothetical protein